MLLKFKDLSERHILERENQPKNLSLRIHRALSWLNRSEQCADDDGKYIFLWIAFNSAYANELNGAKIRTGEQYKEFLTKILDLDTEKKLEALIWNQYSHSIRVLLDNKYIFQPYWNFVNNNGCEDWETSFGNAKIKAMEAIINKDTSTVLSIIFSRLYILRNQLMHGCSTWNGSVNRDQLRDASRILGDIIPDIIKVMMDNSDKHWAEACYPVQD